jgi:hypothetical protein
MSKRLTNKEFIKKAKQLHNNKYDYSKTEYITSRNKVIIICPEHGEFEQLPSSHLQGNGCPKCARIWTDGHKENLQKSSRQSRGMTTDEWIERAKQVHGDKYDYSQTVYVNQRTNVKIICPIHGVFEQKADSHIRGNGCRLCGLESENHKGVHNWSDGQRKKIVATCRERYSVDRYLDSDEGKEKIANIKSTSEFRSKMRNIISSDEIQSKTRMTSLNRYGVEFPAQTKEVQDKIYRTKKKNHTVTSSKSEIRMYNILIDRFGKDDVVHQYKHDTRYPFVCDFYIKSLDLFIELNAHWSHGSRWFDYNNADDLHVLDKWKSKAYDEKSLYYEAAITTWTVRDVKKKQTAIDNKLNYVVFWQTDLSDFMDWINSDPLILNNIL